MLVVTEYEECLRRNDYVSRLSHGRRMLRGDGGPNRYFLIYLVSDQVMAIEFLNGVVHPARVVVPAGRVFKQSNMMLQELQINSIFPGFHAFSCLNLCVTYSVFVTG